MAKIRTAVRTESFSGLRTERYASGQVPIHHVNLVHCYVRLDLDHEVECAGTKEDALRYLNAVADASTIVHQVAGQPEFAGLLLEAQGATIHAGIPNQGNYRETAVAFAAAVHCVLGQRMAAHPCVKGWRMATDAGQTLVIVSPDVHGDHSLVSIGNAANRPAKHLYQQLSVPEEVRQLKKYRLAVRTFGADQWEHIDLQHIPVSRTVALQYENLKSKIEYRVQLSRSGESERAGIAAQAQPVVPAGDPDAPTATRPAQHHGWVMRADLDGFTAQVEVCFDQTDRLNEMALWFADLMDSAASFVNLHAESMVQLPWAGDNFTVAVVYENKDQYNKARAERLVNHALDFDDETREMLGDKRWAYGVCGGEVHGNAVGNVFIGSVEFDGIRFLLGAGVGFARSLQAFADIKPAGGMIEIMGDDYQLLADLYKPGFGPAKKTDESVSSLFKEGSVSALGDARDDEATSDRSIKVQTAPTVTTPLLIKPYAKRH